MPCSFCKTNSAQVQKDYRYQPIGVAVCNHCFGEVNKIMNFVNNEQQETSISYPADTNWGGKRVEVMEDRKSFHTDLADAFRKGIYSDIQVKPSRGDSIRAHRIVLATRSVILKNMLESDSCKIAPEDSISLPDFDHDELDTFLEFLYRGNLPTEKLQTHCCSLLKAADKYDILHLQKFCERRLVALLNSANALKTLKTSDVVSNKTIKVAALELIAQQFDEIVSKPGVEDFTKENPQLMVEIAKALNSSRKRTRNSQG